MTQTAAPTLSRRFGTWASLISLNPSPGDSVNEAVTHQISGRLQEITERSEDGFKSPYFPPGWLSLAWLGQKVTQVSGDVFFASTRIYHSRGSKANHRTPLHNDLQRFSSEISCSEKSTFVYSVNVCRIWISQYQKKHVCSTAGILRGIKMR